MCVYVKISMVIYMRLRNVKNADILIKKSEYLVKDYEKNKGKWKSVFSNNNPIYVEIGMGKGDFIISEALRNKNINYIGIEKYESVILRAIQKLEDLDIPNLRLICMDADDIDLVFKKEVSNIYLNFSDPWPKNKHRERRLSSSSFLEKYKSIVVKKVVIEMKTDNDNLFNYSLREYEKNGFKVLDIDRDYGNNKNNISKTEYEKKFISKGKNINYVKVEC